MDDGLTTALKGAILTTAQVRERDIVYYACQQVGTALTFERNPSFARSELDPLFWSQRQGEAWAAALRYEMKTLAHVFRHIIGNPFRPYPAPPAWLSTVVQLAESLYAGQDCAFALHDALLEAGHAELAKHFREEKSHPKGCWAMDLILGKK
jgi:hypothetical protein